LISKTQGAIDESYGADGERTAGYSRVPNGTQAKAIPSAKRPLRHAEVLCFLTLERFTPSASAG
jgi:hypothetical protein